MTSAVWRPAPSSPYSRSEIQASSPSVVTSPRLAAMGVATLSGSQRSARASTTTAAITRPSTRLARLAVTRAEATSSSACSRLHLLVSGSQSMVMPTSAARKPTTMPWHWTSTRLPATMLPHTARLSSLPRLAAVERREASVISRLPLRPSSAGTMMITPTSEKTGQYCTTLSTSPAATMPSPAMMKVGKTCGM